MLYSFLLRGGFKLFDLQLLLDSQDNLIDQLCKLRLYSDKLEVKKYIEELLKSDLHPYVRYCVDKYYFEKNVEEVPFSSYYNNNPALPWFSDSIQKLLKNGNTYEEKIDILVEHKQEEEVNRYVAYLLSFTTGDIPYIRYLILKKFYGIDVEEVKPSVKTMKYKLWHIDIHDKKREKRKKLLSKIKPGQKVHILDGNCSGLDGTVTFIDETREKAFVSINLFGEDCSFEVDCRDIGLRRRKK